MKKIDLRHSIGFFCMLRACALIEGLRPGESVFIISDDNEFLPDLRRVHPECDYRMLSDGKGRMERGEYLFRVRKNGPEHPS